MAKQHWLIVVVIVLAVAFVRFEGSKAALKEAAPKEAVARTVTWEKLEQSGHPFAMTLYRAKVQGGWLVGCDRERSKGTGTGITFVPDPQHTWTVGIQGR